METDLRIMETGVAESVEETSPGPGGVRILLSTKSPYRDPEGRVIGLIGVSTDITERKRAEDKLRESEARLREAQRLAHVGSWSWDVDSDTTTWSEEMYRITGWDRNRPAPSYDERAALYSPESWVRLSEAMQRALATGEPWELDVDIIGPDGAVRRVHSSGAAVRDESGRVVRLNGTLQDITDQKRAEEALRQSNRKLHQLSRDLLRTQDYERRRIARELHDSTAQLLAALSINLSRLRDSGLEPDRREQVLSEAIDLAAACSAEIRTVTYLLHPPLLEEVGLAARVAGVRSGFQPADWDSGQDQDSTRFRPARQRDGEPLFSASSRKGWQTSTNIRAAGWRSSGWNAIHAKSGWSCRTGATALPRRCAGGQGIRPLWRRHHGHAGARGAAWRPVGDSLRTRPAQR